MSIQWLWVTEIRKKNSFLFCFSNTSRWSATLLHTTNCQDKSSLHAPVNTTHAGPEATTLKNSVLVCCESKHGQQDIFQFLGVLKYSPHTKFDENPTLWIMGNLYLSFWLWPQTVYIALAYTRFDLKLLSRSAESPKYLLAVWAVTSNMHGHAHWTDFVSVCAMNEDFLASFC